MGNFHYSRVINFPYNRVLSKVSQTWARNGPMFAWYVGEIGNTAVKKTHHERWSKLLFAPKLNTNNWCLVCRQQEEEVTVHSLCPLLVTSSFLFFFSFVPSDNDQRRKLQHTTFNFSKSKYFHVHLFWGFISLRKHNWLGHTKAFPNSHCWELRSHQAH